MKPQNDNGRELTWRGAWFQVHLADVSTGEVTLLTTAVLMLLTPQLKRYRS